MFTSSTATIRQLCRCFYSDQSGATAIEYALIASGISIAIAATVLTLGAAVQNEFTSVATALK
jgi:pilus assembly protein Flp/PilA